MGNATNPALNGFLASNTNERIKQNKPTLTKPLKTGETNQDPTMVAK